MAFNPLGNFDPAAPLNADALAEARAFLAKLPDVPAGALERIYAHWSVGHYNQDFDDYNAAVRYDGQHFHLDICGDPRDNAIGVNNNPTHSHTYMRNTGAFGISTDDMAGATEHDFGPEPVTLMALEFLCAGIAAAARKYGVDVSGTSARAPYAGEPTMLTHAEAANRVGNPVQYSAYGPKPIGDVERWDLASFVATPDGVDISADTATTCGDALRTRTHAYKVALM